MNLFTNIKRVHEIRFGKNLPSTVYLVAAIATTSLTTSKISLADQAIILGGGSNVSSSQETLETNVKWMQGVLAKSGIVVTTFYTDGAVDTPDIYYKLQEEENTTTQLPIARTFGDYTKELTRYRNHTVPGVVESTDRTKLEPILDVLLGATNTDSSLFIYNGHGSNSNTTPDKVYLRLWNDTKFSANDLHKILDDSQAPFRFIFNQCYSGGFHRVAYKNPEKGLELAEGQRCGFTAESAYQPTEECSSSIHSSDYQDYTSYFFAALSGYYKDGEIIHKDPDVNTDSRVSLREAHLFTLEHAYSADLARSTSEDYLTSWEPWFLKWLPGSSYLPNNEYAKLFRDIAVKYNLPLEKGASKIIRMKQESIKSEFNDLSKSQTARNQELQDVKNSLQTKVIAQWPSLAGPYTGAFAEFAKSEKLGIVSDWIALQPEYNTIIELEKLIAQMDADLLDSQRTMTQLYKLMRLRRLANLKQWLYDYGSPGEIADYEKLLLCEDQPIKP